MPTTPRGAPYPTTGGLVGAGATDIQALAEWADGVAGPPALTYLARAQPDWSVDGAIGWDTESSAPRGAWSTQAWQGEVTDALVYPPTGGWYIVTATVRLAADDAANSYAMAIRVRNSTGQLSPIGGTTSGPPGVDGSMDLSTSAIVRIPGFGSSFLITASYSGGTVPVATLGATRLSCYRLSPL